MVKVIRLVVLNRLFVRVVENLCRFEFLFGSIIIFFILLYMLLWLILRIDRLIFVRGENIGCEKFDKRFIGFKFKF